MTLIRSGEFVSILPMSVSLQHVMRGGMRVLPLPPLEPLGEVVAYWRADSSMPAAQLFIECLAEAASELLGD
ncbi:lysR substrate binding domain protein [Burkholderia pseudomallei MSHR3709]|nr:lysR substrate binding domain protein [Burkholderia pseudomallei MSHR3709]